MTFDPVTGRRNKVGAWPLDNPPVAYANAAILAGVSYQQGPSGLRVGESVPVSGVEALNAAIAQTAAAVGPLASGGVEAPPQAEVA